MDTPKKIAWAMSVKKNLLDALENSHLEKSLEVAGALKTRSGTTFWLIRRKFTSQELIDDYYHRKELDALFGKIVENPDMIANIGDPLVLGELYMLCLKKGRPDLSQRVKEYFPERYRCL